jgi:CRP-like cAMP-binding protein
LSLDPHDWQIIRSTALFRAMSQEAAQSLIGNQPVCVYRKGTVLFHQGEIAESFYVILEGWVKLYRITPEGSEAVVSVFHRGETFAEAAIFLGGRYPVCAEVVTPARLLKVEGKRLRDRIRAEPDLALSMLASFSHHLKSLVDQIEQIKLLSAQRLIADFLVKLCPVRQGACMIELPYEKALIAGRLGIKPESLSRALAKLRPMGVSVEGDHVSIAEVGDLARFVGS